ncbi:MAG: hypothetical protein WCI18_00795 [Pseudomonadota bacterium]
MRILTFWILCIFTSVSFAGSVEKIGKSGPIVLMDSESEWPVGSHVCFVKEGKKKACGVVSKVKGLKALVKVKKSSLSKVEKGMTAKLSKSAKKAALDPSGEMAQEATKENSGPPEEISSSDKTKKVSVKSRKNRIRIYAGASYAPITVFKSNNLKYNPPNPAEPGALWAEESKVSSGAALILAGMFGPFHGGLGYSISGMIPNNNVDLDYSISEPTKYVSLTSKRSFLGLFGDYLFTIQKSPINIAMGAGLGYSSNNIKFSAIQKNDSGADANVIASGTSSISVISLRVPALVMMDLGPIGIQLGATLSLGLSGTAKTSATVTDPNSPDAAAGAATFSSALGHSKNMVGFELFGGIGASF